METIVVALTLTVAVCYAGWRFYEAISHADDPCHGCSGCQLKGGRNCEKQEKRGFRDKK